MNATLEKAASAFAHFDAIPTERAVQLIALLESAPTEALEMIVARKVKFCWRVAQRILNHRKAGAA